MNSQHHQNQKSKLQGCNIMWGVWTRMVGKSLSLTSSIRDGECEAEKIQLLPAFHWGPSLSAQHHVWGPGLSTHPDRRHGDPLRCLNVVPYTQIVTVLSYQHITSRDPLHIGAEVEDHGLWAAFNIVQVQLKEAESTVRMGYRFVFWFWALCLKVKWPTVSAPCRISKLTDLWPLELMCWFGKSWVWPNKR